MTTILVLEDDPLVRTLLRCMLRPFTLIDAESAEQSLQCFTGECREIDFLIADVTLPAGSGVEVALLLRSEAPDLPVIWISGSAAKRGRLPLLLLERRCIATRRDRHRGAHDGGPIQEIRGSGRTRAPVPPHLGNRDPISRWKRQDVADILAISQAVVRKHYAKAMGARQDRFTQIFAAVYPGAFQVHEKRGSRIN